MRLSGVFALSFLNKIVTVGFHFYEILNKGKTFVETRYFISSKFSISKGLVTFANQNKRIFK